MKCKEKETSLKRKTKKIKRLLINLNNNWKKSTKISRILTPNLVMRKLLLIKFHKNSRKKKSNCQSKLTNFQNSKKSTKNRPKKLVNNWPNFKLKWTKSILHISFLKKKTTKKYWIYKRKSTDCKLLCRNKEVKSLNMKSSFLLASKRMNN